MCRHAAESMDRQASSATLDTAMAKRYATEACCQVADDAVQVSAEPPHCILLSGTWKQPTRMAVLCPVYFWCWIYSFRAMHNWMLAGISAGMKRTVLPYSRAAGALRLFNICCAGVWRLWVSEGIQSGAGVARPQSASAAGGHKRDHECHHSQRAHEALAHWQGRQ